MSEISLTPASNQEILIRNGALADLGALALVMERAYAQRDNLPLLTTINEASLKEVEVNLNTHSVWTYVAVSGRRVAGFALGFPTSEASSIATNPKDEYLSLLMVDPDFWGRGIGSRLLDIAEKRACQTGKERILLWTRQANNSRSQSIYERRHYKRTGKTKADGPYGPQYQYQLDLDA